VQIPILCEPEEANIFMFDRFDRPDFNQVVVFLDCPLHRGHRTCRKCGARMTADQSGKVRIRVLDSGPATQQLFYQCAKEKLKRGRVPYGAECGPGCRCRVRSPVLCGTVPFYGTGARADAQIRPVVPDPRLTPQTAYHIF
jgi:hypothetical protein